MAPSIKPPIAPKIPLSIDAKNPSLFSTASLVSNPASIRPIMIVRGAAIILPKLANALNTVFIGVRKLIIVLKIPPPPYAALAASPPIPRRLPIDLNGAATDAAKFLID